MWGTRALSDNVWRCIKLHLSREVNAPDVNDRVGRSKKTHMKVQCTGPRDRPSAMSGDDKVRIGDPLSDGSWSPCGKRQQEYIQRRITTTTTTTTTICLGIGAQSTLGQDIFARKLYMKNFQNGRICTTFAWKINKIPEFYMIITRKIFSHLFFWGGGAPCPAVSYAFDNDKMHRWLNASKELTSR